MNTYIIAGGIILAGVSVAAAWLVQIRARTKIAFAAIDSKERELMRARAERRERDGWRGINEDALKRAVVAEKRNEELEQQLLQCHNIMAATSVSGSRIEKVVLK